MGEAEVNYDKEHHCNISNIYNTALIPTSSNLASISLEISAVLDSGASGTFIKINAKSLNVKTANNSIYMKETGGNVSQSTHMCDLHIDGVPPEACQGHIVPKIISHSLLTVTSLCDSDCLVLISAKTFYIIYKNTVTHTGDRYVMKKL